MKMLIRSLFLLLLLCNIILCKAQIQPSAQWIAADVAHPDSVNTWMAFRKDIEVKRLPSHAVAQIAADSKYWLWINGKQVVFEGGLKRGPNSKDTCYDEIELAPYFKKGTNRIAVLVWHFGKDGFSHKNSGQSGFIFNMVSKEVNLCSDASWQSCIHPAYENTKEPYPNWRLPESNIRFVAERDLNTWQTDDIVVQKYFRSSKERGAWGSAPWNNLVKRPIPFWKDYGVKQAIADRSLSDSTIIYTANLPYNMQMCPVIELDDMDGGTTLFIETDHTLAGGATNLRAEYVTKKGYQRYESLGWMNGEKIIVRYDRNSSIKDLKISYRETGYDAAPTGNFSCDDEFIMRFWKKALRTLYVNMRDTYFDCPDRERAQWWGDVVTLMGESFYTYSTSANLLMRKAIRELVDWQRADKTLFAPIPSGNYSTELPAQMLASIGKYGFWNYYMNTGDKETIEYVYPHVKDYLSIWQLDATGLTVERKGEWAWGDWGTHVDMRLLLAAWHYMALDAAVNMALLTGNDTDVPMYNSQMESIKKAFNQCWNGYAYRHPQYHGETDDRVQALAIVSGIADETKYNRLSDVLTTQWHASPYMEKYVMEALCRAGHNSFALKRMKKRFAPMVNDSRHTTLFEGWEEGGFGGGSTNHAWSGGGLTVIAQYICGITPTKEGYATFDVKPCPNVLKAVSIEFPTVKGMIASAFADTPHQFTLSVTVPQGSEATVILPYEKLDHIKLNGKPVPIRYHAGNDESGKKRYILPSGSYTLMADKPDE